MRLNASLSSPHHAEAGNAAQMFGQSGTSGASLSTFSNSLMQQSDVIACFQNAFPNASTILQQQQQGGMAGATTGAAGQTGAMPAAGTQP